MKNNKIKQKFIVFLLRKKFSEVILGKNTKKKLSQMSRIEPPTITTISNALPTCTTKAYSSGFVIRLCKQHHILHRFIACYVKAIANCLWSDHVRRVVHMDKINVHRSLFARFMAAEFFFVIFFKFLAK